MSTIEFFLTILGLFLGLIDKDLFSNFKNSERIMMVFSWSKPIIIVAVGIFSIVFFINDRNEVEIVKEHIADFFTQSGSPSDAKNQFELLQHLNNLEYEKCNSLRALVEMMRDKQLLYSDVLVLCDSLKAKFTTRIYFLSSAYSKSLETYEEVQ